MISEPEQTATDPLKNEADHQKRHSTGDVIHQPEQNELKPHAEKQPPGIPDKVIIPDECGDSLWEDVLAQNKP